MHEEHILFACVCVYCVTQDLLTGCHAKLIEQLPTSFLCLCVDTPVKSAWCVTVAFAPEKEPPSSTLRDAWKIA